MKQSNKAGSLGKKLNQLLLVCFVPLTIALLFLIYMNNRISQQYDQVVSNITTASAYSLDFKERLDYTMYIIVVNSERASELITDEPHALISDARENFSKLLLEEGDTEARNLLEQIIQSMDSIEDEVSLIEEDATKVGMYDTNLERLDLDIRVITELIQDEIQQYISTEAEHLEELRITIRKNVERTVLLSLILLAVVLVIALGISRRIMGSLTLGIRELQKVTRKAGKGDFTVRAELSDSEEELSELGEGFNQMVERLGTLVEDIRVEQLQLRKTEQKLLQAQINPHFLYNTLDAIIWLAESGEKEQVVYMVTALSDFFRTTLSKGRDFITVEEEESHIRSYLKIQQFRYQDILEYEISIPREMYRYSILKLTLQPLVENALYHGIKNKRGRGRISVKGELEGGKMIFTVTDNGIGMTPERLRQVQKDMNQDVRGNTEPEGFGLYNVAQRIRLNYGAEFDLILESTYGEGSVCKVVIPAKEIKNDLFL